MITKADISQIKKETGRIQLPEEIEDEYDDDYECYTCEMDLDEDEMYKFLTDSWKSCPYYRNNDEYEVVRHQM